MQKHGALVMGRKTYDAIQKYGKALIDLFEKLNIKKIIVSGDKEFCPKSEYIIARTPKDAISSSSENNVLVSSGPTLNMELLKNGLVDRVILYVLPIAIGDGIEPFDKEARGNFVPMKNSESVEGIKIYKYRIAGK
jgi:dihydrofolate reductase